MEKRKYVRYTEVYEKLERFCIDRYNEGNLFLPSERNLAQMFGASLMTIRKAVEEALNNGIITRSGRHTNIRQNRCFSKLGKILFVSGNSDKVLLPAIERLHLLLKPEIEKFGGLMDVFIDTPDTTPAELLEQLRQADLVLLTCLASTGKNLEQKIKYLQAFESKRKLILLSTTYSDLFQNIVALDDTAVGEAAAEALNQAECSNALILGGIPDIINFNRRMQGFCSVFNGRIRNYRRNFQENVIQFLSDEIREIDEAVAQGTDCIFLVTDEWTPCITAGLFARKLVPDKVKIITVNGSGECYLCPQPIANVSHCTATVAAQLLSVLKKISYGTMDRRIKNLIRPHIHECKTLKILNKEAR